MGLQHLLPKLKQQSNKKNVLNQPLFIDILIRDEEKSGWKSDIKAINTGW
jgi:hypothetical protein